MGISLNSHSNIVSKKLKQYFITEVLLFSFVLIVYSQTFLFQFISLDDPQNIFAVKDISFESVLAFWEDAYFGLYIPVSYTVWSGVSWISTFLFGQIHPTPFHVLNVLLHALNCVLLFQITFFCTKEHSAKAIYASAIGCLVFALHPIQVEAISWVTGARDLLSTFFGLLAIRFFLLSFTESRQRDVLIYCISTTFFGLSILSKPNGIVLPIILFFLCFFRLGFPVKEVLLKLAAWVAACSPIIFLSRSGQPESVITFMSAGVAWWQKPLLFMDSIVFYFKKILIPFPLILDYGRKPIDVIADSGSILLAVSVILVGAFLLRNIAKGMRSLYEGILYFVFFLLPVSGLIAFEFQIFSTVADRYLYFPMAGIAIGLSFFLAGSDSFWRSHRLQFVAFGLGLYLTAGTLLQLPVWKNSETVLLHTIKGNPKSYLANQSLAAEYFDKRIFDKALIYFQSAIEVNPYYLDPKYGFGKTLILLDRPVDAVNFYKSFLGDTIGFPSNRGGTAQILLGNILADYGIALEKIGEAEEAEKQFQRALDAYPDQPIAKSRIPLRK